VWRDVEEVKVGDEVRGFSEWAFVSGDVDPHGGGLGAGETTVRFFTPNKRRVCIKKQLSTRTLRSAGAMQSLHSGVCPARSPGLRDLMNFNGSQPPPTAIGFDANASFHLAERAGACVSLTPVTVPRSAAAAGGGE